MKHIIITGLATLALIGCESEDPALYDYVEMDESSALRESAPKMRTSQALQAVPASASQSTVMPDAPDPSASAPLLAYSYNVSLELPAKIVAQVQGRHGDKCRAAGHEVCQIISAVVTNPNSPRPYAHLQIRAKPDWISTFRETLNEETDAQGGNILADETRVDDLTAQIVDSEARLKAKIVLRDRLQALLETREGSLSDLLAVERELAKVQAQLDAQASVLAAMRQQVDTSKLMINYQAKRDVITPGEFDPIGQAFKEIGEVFANNVATLILFLAAALPWLVILVPLISFTVLGFRRLLRRRKAAS